MMNRFKARDLVHILQDAYKVDEAKILTDLISKEGQLYQAALLNKKNKNISLKTSYFYLAAGYLSYEYAKTKNVCGGTDYEKI